MKSLLSLTMIVCLIGSSLPLAAQERLEPTSGLIIRAIAREAARRALDPQNDSGAGGTQARDRIDTGIRIFVTTEPSGDRNENDVRGLQDSTRDLRIRLQERVGRLATIVGDPAQASLTIVVTRREIAFETNLVHALLAVGDFQAQFTGRDEGMWGPAATDLAKAITAWLSANASQLRAITQAGSRVTADRLKEPAGASANTNWYWSRVRRLEPGTEIMVTANASRSGKRFVLSADESSMTVLNLTDAALPLAVRDVLRDRSRHPEYFTAAQRGETLLLGENVRLTGAGVFVADQKVVDLSQMVESIPRADLEAGATVIVARTGMPTDAKVGIWVGVGVFVAVVSLYSVSQLK